MKKYFPLALIFVVLVIFCPNLYAATYVYEADIIPWSGHWWPYDSGELVYGYNSDHPDSSQYSPIEKYDLAVQGTAHGSAYSEGIDLYYDPDAGVADGLCFSWSAAAILEKEPSNRGIYNNIIFNVGDKKGLLTALYYRTTYNKNGISKPEDLQYVLEEFIKKRRTPVVMNLGEDGVSSGQIWNYPVYKYETTYSTNTASNTRSYTTTLYFATDDVNPDYRGALIHSRTYKYTITLDSEDVVIDSEWGDAYKDTHPSYGHEVLESSCLNSGLDYDQVISIVYTDDDVFEGKNISNHSAGKLLTRDYELLALGDDYYYFPLETGDTLKINFDGESGASFTISLYTPSGKLAGTLTNKTSGEFSFEASDQGNHLLKVEPADPEFQPDYRLSIRHGMGHTYYSYAGISAMDWDSELHLQFVDEGFDAESRLTISLVDAGGTIYDAIDITTDADQISGYLTADPFGFDKKSYAYLMIESDKELKGYYSISDGEDELKGKNLFSKESAASSIVYPHYAGVDNWSTTYSVMNLGDENETVSCTAYDSNGTSLGTKTFDLSSGQKYTFLPVTLGYTSSSLRSLILTTVSGRSSLAGIADFTNSLYLLGTNCSAGIPAQSVATASSSLVVPHVSSGNNWLTGIVIMNVGEISTNVYLAAYDNQGYLISASLVALNPNQTVVAEMGMFFPDVAYPMDIACVRIESDNGAPLVGLLKYISSDLSQVAGMAVCPTANSVSSTSLPGFGLSNPLYTGVGVMNTGSLTDTFVFSAYDEFSNLISQNELVLVPNQRIAMLLSELTGISDISSRNGYLKIDSKNGQTCLGMYLMGDVGFGESGLLLGDCID